MDKKKKIQLCDVMVEYDTFVTPDLFKYTEYNDRWEVIEGYLGEIIEKAKNE